MNLRWSGVAQTCLFIFVGLNGILELFGIPTAVTKFLLLGVVIGIFFLYGALIFTIWSGLDYFIKARKFLML